MHITNRTGFSDIFNGRHIMKVRPGVEKGLKSGLQMCRGNQLKCKSTVPCSLPLKTSVTELTNGKWTGSYIYFCSIRALKPLYTTCVFYLTFAHIHTSMDVFSKDIWHADFSSDSETF